MAKGGGHCSECGVCLYSFMGRVDHDMSGTSNVCLTVYVRKLMRCMTLVFRRQFGVKAEHRVWELSACSTNSCLCKLRKITHLSMSLFASMQNGDILNTYLCFFICKMGI